MEEVATLNFIDFGSKDEEFLAHYHKRSNVESVFQMIKSKLGERNGVVLEKTFRASQLIRSPDLFNESEVLIRGIVTAPR